MPRPSPSPLARALEPLVASVWLLFILWTVLVAIVWTLGIGEVELTAWVRNPDLRAALLAVLKVLDLTWITLAATNIYLCVVAAERISVARRWALLVLAGSIAIAWASAATRYPLGPLHYTSRLGMRLGPVPMGVPLLWIAVVFGAREAALRFLPRASHAQVAGAAGLLGLLTALNLEPLAWTARSWWLWYPAGVDAVSWPPLRNYLTWLVAVALFAFLMRPQDVVAATRRRSSRPIIALALIHGVCLAAHAARWLA